MDTDHLDPALQGAARKRPALVYIQQKLERVLHSRESRVAAYSTEIISIVDALDAINRDHLGMRSRSHLGDSDRD